jgi:hypothetical protein
MCLDLFRVLIFVTRWVYWRSELFGEEYGIMGFLYANIRIQELYLCNKWKL